MNIVPRLFSDQLDVLNTAYPNAGGRATGIMRQAILTAYNNIGSMHQWSYLRRRTQITTNAPYSTGTISSSGTTVTLATGTWPAWSGSAQLIVGNAVYRAARRVSGSSLTLQSDRSPADDIASGTSYTLVQTEYLLPAGWSKLGRMVGIGSAWETTYVPPEESLELARLLFGTTRPWRFTIRGAQYGPTGRRVLEFLPPPDAAYTFDLLYEASPTPRRLASTYNAGSIIVSGSAITGVGTAFTSAMIGCHLRVGTDTKPPTGPLGEYPTFADYEVIAVADATHLTIGGTAEASSGVLFVIDDAVDIEPGPVLSLFDKMCMSEFEDMNNLDTRAASHQRMIEAYRAAMAADSPTGKQPLSGFGSTTPYDMVNAQHSVPRSSS